MVEIDKYQETNQNDYGNIYDTHPSAAARCCYAQSFTNLADKYKITSCKFYLRKNGASSAGTLKAILYAHSGTYGSSSVPTGSPLATSDAVDVATGLGLTFAIVEFTFSGAEQYEMQSGVKYCIALEYDVSTNPSGVDIGWDTSSPTHGGNASVHNAGSWSASANDICFYVYGSLSAVITGSSHSCLSPALLSIIECMREKKRVEDKKKLGLILGLWFGTPVFEAEE